MSTRNNRLNRAIVFHRRRGETMHGAKVKLRFVAKVRRRKPKILSRKVL